jgi:glutaredoxin
VSEVVLYSAAGCHLCDDAVEMLESLDVAYRVASDPRFAERIPVIEIDGRIVTEGRVSVRAVRAALRRAEGQPQG